METTSVSARVRLRPPPPGLMRILNPFVRRALTGRLGRRMRLQALLEFDGRHTGKRRRVPVCVYDIDGIAMVFTARPWRLNFVDGAPVTVTQRGGARHGHAQLVDATPEQVGTALRTAFENGATPFDLGVKVPRGYDPTVDDFAQLATQLIRIDFDDE